MIENSKLNRAEVDILWRRMFTIVYVLLSLFLTNRCRLRLALQTWFQNDAGVWKWKKLLSKSSLKIWKFNHQHDIQPNCYFRNEINFSSILSEFWCCCWCAQHFILTLYFKLISVLLFDNLIAGNEWNQIRVRVQGESSDVSFVFFTLSLDKSLHRLQW